MSIRYQTAIVGAAETTQIWRIADMSSMMLAADAAMNAIEDCGIDKNQIDAVLYGRHIAGARVVAVFDLIGLAVAIAVALWQPRPEPPPRRVLPPPRVAVPPPRSP